MIRIFFGGLENGPVGQMDSRSKVFCPSAPIRLYCADDLGGRIGFGVEAVLHDCFNSHGAGDFAMDFASHAVGKHEEVEALNDLVTIFVVGAPPTHIGHAATCDSHTNSHCRPEITPRPTPVPGNSVPTLTEPQDRRKALNPTDYSLFRYMRAGSDQPRAVGACIAFIGRRFSTTIPRMSWHCRVLAFIFACLIAGVLAPGVELSSQRQRLPEREYFCCRGESFRASAPRSRGW